MGKLSQHPGTPNFVPCFFLLTRRITLVESCHAAGTGGRREVVPTSKDSKHFSLLLPSHERITLVESGHAAGRGGVGKLSQRSETPNFVPCFFFLTREYPWLSLVTQQGGEAWGSFPTPRDSKLCSLLLPPHGRITLVESGQAAGTGKVGKMFQTPRDSILCSLLLPSHERITLVESGYGAGRRGKGKFLRRHWTPNFVVCFFFHTRKKTLVESGHAAGRGEVGKFSRRPGTPNFVPCFFLLTRE